MYPCLTLFSGFSPRVPPKMKRGIIEENEHEQPAGKAAINSAVARGGAGGARAPPVFFLKSKNRPV